MTTYTYIAIDSRGRRISGELEASDPDAVVSELTAQGLRIESVQTARGTASPESARPGNLSQVETREVGRHISEIVSAGLPLESGLAAIAEEFPRGRVRRELRAIVRDLEAGNNLESVLAVHRTPAYLPALVRAGQRSGRTGEILENFIAGTQVVSDLRQTLWLALAYPLILLLLLFPVGLLLLLRIVPQFGSIFEGFEVRLPAMTMALLTISELLVDHGGWVLAILIGAILAIAVLIRLALGKVATRRFVCRMPFIGPLLRCSALARFSPVLSVLVDGRVPIDEALILAGDAAGDAAIREDCRKLAASVRSGKTLEEAANESQGFPASFIRTLSWERHRDGFPEVLRSMADMYAGRARALVALLVAVLPVLVVVLVGSVVGLTVIALFMPLIELLNKLS